MLDKAIAHGKEHRKPYRKSRRFDRACRNHGSCGYCWGNRTYAGRRAEAAARQDQSMSMDEPCDGTCPICWPEAWRWDESAGRYEPTLVAE